MKKNATTFAVLLLTLTICGAGMQASPMNPSPGETVTISGQANPKGTVTLSSSFDMNIPVTDGSYEYLAKGVEIPQKPNRFTVTARNVEDLNVGVKFGIWLTKSVKGSGGSAYVSQSDVPPGRYTLKLFGKANPGSNAVLVQVKADTTVTADSNGLYSLRIDTEGIPVGDYKVEAAGETLVLKIGGGSQTDDIATENKDTDVTSTSGSSSSSSSKGDGSTSSKRSESSNGIEITSDVVKWYAKKVNLDPDKDFEEAKEALESRTKNRSWIIIAKGDELSEECGTCQDDYCIVRGVGACTTCKIKCELGNRSDNVTDQFTNYNENTATQTGETGVQEPTEDNTTSKDITTSDDKTPDKGFISWLWDLWLSITNKSGT